MAANFGARNLVDGCSPDFGSESIIFPFGALCKRIIVDKRSDKPQGGASDVESTPPLGPSEDHKIVPPSPSAWCQLDLDRPRTRGASCLPRGVTGPFDR